MSNPLVITVRDSAGAVLDTFHISHWRDADAYADANPGKDVEPFGSTNSNRLLVGRLTQHAEEGSREL